MSTSSCKSSSWKIGRSEILCIRRCKHWPICTDMVTSTAILNQRTYWRWQAQWRLPISDWLGRSEPDLPSRSTFRRAGTGLLKCCCARIITIHLSICLQLVPSWLNCIVEVHYSLGRLNATNYTKYCKYSARLPKTNGHRATSWLLVSTSNCHSMIQLLWGVSYHKLPLLRCLCSKASCK